MKPPVRLVLVPFVAMTVFAFNSCSNSDEFQDRMDRRNDSYSNYDQRRRARLDARQERTDQWFDRAMR
jgi:hypothetical protein